MSKLYPPQIGGTIPAFYKQLLGNGKFKPLTIPFIMNKTVAKSEIASFNLIIKTVANNKLIGNLKAEPNENEVPPWDFSKGEVYFNIPEEHILWTKLYPGQYYKVQLAYIDKQDEIGYYSSVGIFKFTTRADVDIENMHFTKVNMNENVYVGTYSQARISNTEARDSSEKVYSYCFNVYDSKGDLFDTSGDQIHNSFEDENAYSSRDIFTLNKELEINKNYYIQYTVKTSNNAIFKSSKYRIMSKETIDPELEADLVVKLNRDNGYVDVRLIGKKDENGTEYAANGSFVLKRGCSKDNYTTWNSILMFRLNGHQPSRWLWKDMTVEHGYHYKYSLQQFNDAGLHSNKLYSNEIYITFEDSFLYDGEKQLKLRFNPKVTSFKDVLLESKTNTIGSKYPFIFRNGRVSYKEFPISGLVSYLIDEEELFTTKDELFLEQPDTNLTDNNIAAERIFKLKVLEFFNDGKPKIFRSPTEGNYIVRLMNTSMTPDDKVGRMLHTISTTASEVSDFNYNSLLEHGFLKLIDTAYYATRWETIQMVDTNDGSYRLRPAGEELLNYSATSLHFENIMPGAQFKVVNEFGESDTITIGITGTYQLELGMNFKSVKIVTPDLTQGSLIYSYESNASNVFDTIEDIQINDYPLVQYVGENNIITNIDNNIKTSLLDFTYLRFNKRAVYNLYAKKNGNIYSYYWDEACQSEADNQIEAQYVYKVTDVSGDQYEEFYIDGQYPQEKKEYSNSYIINGSSIDLTETEYQQIIKPDKITELKMGLGLTLECAYQTKELIYTLESTNVQVKTAKEAYDNALAEYLKWLEYDYDVQIYDGITSYNNDYLTKLNNAYNVLYGKDENGKTLKDRYIEVLSVAIEKQKEDNKK